MQKFFSNGISPFIHGILSACLLIFLTVSQTIPAAAQETTQTGERVILSTADITKFPTIHLNLDVYDANNTFVSDLKPEEVQVLENDRSLAVESLERQEPGLQFIVAVNAAPIMATSVENQTLFARVQNALVQWARTRSASTNDDFSLSTNQGPEAIRLADPVKWVETLQNYQPNLADETPGNTSLSQALDLATDPNPRQNMKRAILYVTSAPSDAAVSALPDLASRAADLGVRVFVWLLEAGTPTSAPASDALHKLADASGGQMFVLSGKETLPDLETYLGSLRYTYQATYHSQVYLSGDQAVQVNVTHNSLVASSGSLSYQISVSSPNPILLSPPTLINREWTRLKPGEKETLSPSKGEIQILIEFPDQHRRNLKASRLYVDGRMVVENLQEPFDRFEWPLENYTESRRHEIKIEVEDELGLKGTSIEMPVEVTVASPRQSIWNHILNDKRLLIGIPLFSIALVAIGIMIVTGRRNWWQSLGRHKKSNSSKSTPAKAAPARQEPPSQPRNKPQIGTGWPRPNLQQDAPAQLTPLPESNLNGLAQTIFLNQVQLTIGSDPDRAIQVIGDPSIDGLHARVRQAPDGDFYLADCGSVAGTWINYSPVSSEGGVRLEQGDIIHIGRAAFRFELRTPGAVRKVTVSAYKEE
jgi:pSer/pThr/pTyr-binding forkhead associated (FHA) protein